MDALSLIADHEKVLAVFGRWPSFHDGEILRLVLDSTRRNAAGRRYPSIELVIRGWNLTSQVTNDGTYEVQNDSLVHLLFKNVFDVEVDGLNHQNVLSGLELSLVDMQEMPGTKTLAVELVHCFGLSGGFKAASATVLSVNPYSAART